VEAGGERIIGKCWEKKYTPWEEGHAEHFEVYKWCKHEGGSIALSE